MGVSVQAWPTARNNNLSSGSASHVPVGLQYKYDQLTAYNNPLFLNPVAYSKKYWRNNNRKTWSPVSLTSSEVANQIAVPGYITLNVPTDTIIHNAIPRRRISLNYSVSWYI